MPSTEMLTTAPVLVYPKDKVLFSLDTDASQNSIGAVRSQIQEDNKVLTKRKEITVLLEKNPLLW